MKDKSDLINQKRNKEIFVVSEMIKLYCRKKHGNADFCSECQELVEYCTNKINKCPFMESKTFCNQCSVHCYSKTMQEKIKIVMRYSGPRMLLYHPLMAMHHMVEMIKNKKKRQ